VSLLEFKIIEKMTQYNFDLWFLSGSFGSDQIFPKSYIIDRRQILQ
jgi:hypothetical protein